MESDAESGELDERIAPSGWWGDDDPVFHLDLDVLRQFTERLSVYHYTALQFFPVRFSWNALVSEYRNLVNLVRPTSHRLFGSSVFPGLYLRRLHAESRALPFCVDAFFLNQPVELRALTQYFGQELVDKALEGHLAREENGLARFLFSFVPVGNYILLRDAYELYQKSDVRSRRYRVWLGADSTSFAEFLSFFFKDRRFARALDMGSGTGIQILITSEACERCLAVDYSERAVRFTEINAALNGGGNIEVRYSDLYSNVDGDFDVVLANPFFCELRTGGLEEVPGIADGLGAHLRDGGVCLLTLSSYVRRERDLVLAYLRDFATREKYDVELYTLGYGIESRDRLKSWKQHGITHTVRYNAVLRKGGRGNVQVHDTTPFRKLLQFTKIRAYRMRW